MTVPEIGLTPAGLRQYEEDGFTVVRGLFGPDEVDRLRAEFAALQAAGRAGAGALRAADR